MYESRDHCSRFFHLSYVSSFLPASIRARLFLSLFLFLPLSPSTCPPTHVPRTREVYWILLHSLTLRIRESSFIRLQLSSTYICGVPPLDASETNDFIGVQTLAFIEMSEVISEFDEYAYHQPTISLSLSDDSQTKISINIFLQLRFSK